MGRFIDQHAPSDMLTAPCASSPRFSTQIVMAASGDEQANRRWQHPLWKFHMPECIREQASFEAVRDQWLIMGGPFSTWPFRDPMDFASCPLEYPNVIPFYSGDDQQIGVGDGAETVFQITKTYTRGSQTYVRNIALPVLASLIVLVDGMETLEFTASRPGGKITFDSPPADAAVITCGYVFDCEVRFENDETFEGIVQKFAVAGISDLTLIEVRNRGADE